MKYKTNPIPVSQELCNEKIECENSRCNFAKWLEDDIYINMTASFIGGFLFSGISWGIIYVILFLIVYEFLYFIYKHANHDCYPMEDRIGLVVAALLGYVLGAIFHQKDDFADHTYKFWDDCYEYGKNFDWW
jgi:hypothetical protein